MITTADSRYKHKVYQTYQLTEYEQGLFLIEVSQSKFKGEAFIFIMSTL